MLGRRRGAALLGRARRRTPGAPPASSLGALGVITAVTLRCVPAFTLRGVDRPAPLEETLDALDELRRRQRPLRVLHLPALRRWRSPARTTATDGAPRPPRPRAAVGGGRAARATTPSARSAALGRRLPGAIPRINRLVSRARRAPRRASIAPTAVFASPRLVRFTEMEYALPARARRRGRARRARDDRAARLRRATSRSSCASWPATTRCSARRTAATAAYVAVHMFEGMAFEPLLPRRRGDDGRLRRAPALGQAPLPDGGDAARPLPRVGPLRRRPRAPRPGGPLRERARRAGARARWARRRRHGTPFRGSSGPRRGRSARRPRCASPSTRCSASKRSHSSPALAWRSYTRSPTRRSRAGAPSSGVWTSPAPSWRVEPQAGGEMRARQPVGVGRRPTPGSRRRAPSRSTARACARPAARTAPRAAGLNAR